MFYSDVSSQLPIPHDVMIKLEGIGDINYWKSTSENTTTKIQKCIDLLSTIAKEHVATQNKILAEKLTVLTSAIECNFGGNESHLFLELRSQIHAVATIVFFNKTVAIPLPTDISDQAAIDAIAICAFQQDPEKAKCACYRFKLSQQALAQCALLYIERDIHSFLNHYDELRLWHVKDKSLREEILAHCLKELEKKEEDPEFLCEIKEFLPSFKAMDEAFFALQKVFLLHKRDQVNWMKNLRVLFNEVDKLEGHESVNKLLIIKECMPAAEKLTPEEIVSYLTPLVKRLINLEDAYYEIGDYLKDLVAIDRENRSGLLKIMEHFIEEISMPRTRSSLVRVLDILDLDSFAALENGDPSIVSTMRAFFKKIDSINCWSIVENFPELLKNIPENQRFEVMKISVPFIEKNIKISLFSQVFSAFFNIVTRYQNVRIVDPFLLLEQYEKYQEALNAEKGSLSMESLLMNHNPLTDYLIGLPPTKLQELLQTTFPWVEEILTFSNTHLVPKIVQALVEIPQEQHTPEVVKALALLFQAIPHKFLGILIQEIIETPFLERADLVITLVPVWEGSSLESFKRRIILRFVREVLPRNRPVVVQLLASAQTSLQSISREGFLDHLLSLLESPLKEEMEAKRDAICYNHGWSPPDKAKESILTLLAPTEKEKNKDLFFHSRMLNFLGKLEKPISQKSIVYELSGPAKIVEPNLEALEKKGKSAPETLTCGEAVALGQKVLPEKEAEALKSVGLDVWAKIELYLKECTPTDNFLKSLSALLEKRKNALELTAGIFILELSELSWQASCGSTITRYKPLYFLLLGGNVGSLGFINATDWYDMGFTSLEKFLRALKEEYAIWQQTEKSSEKPVLLAKELVERCFLKQSERLLKARHLTRESVLLKLKEDRRDDLKAWAEDVGGLHQIKPVIVQEAIASAGLASEKLKALLLCNAQMIDPFPKYSAILLQGCSFAEQCKILTEAPDLFGLFSEQVQKQILTASEDYLGLIARIAEYPPNWFLIKSFLARVPVDELVPYSKVLENIQSALNIADPSLQCLFNWQDVVDLFRNIEKWDAEAEKNIKQLFGRGRQTWKLFIDPQFHVLGPLVFDEGKHGGVIEPGYLNGMMSGMVFLALTWSHEILKQPRHKSSLFLILHRIIMRHADKSEYTRMNGSYKVTIPPSRIKEILKDDENVFKEIGETSSAIIMQPSLVEVRDLLLHTPWNAPSIQMVFHHEQVSYLVHFFEKIFEEYFNEMAAASLGEEKRGVIAKFHQKLERFHLFSDGNSRTDIAMLQYELVSHGFPTTQVDPNKAYLLSSSQWKKEIHRESSEWRKHVYTTV